VAELDAIDSVTSLDTVEPLIKIKSMDKITDMIVSTKPGSMHSTYTMCRGLLSVSQTALLASRVRIRHLTSL
jgi:hypothetical protein